MTKSSVVSFARVLGVFLIFFLFSSFNKMNESPKEISETLDQFMQSLPSLPHYMEAGYSPLGRSPVVDTLLADPLYLPVYAEIVTGLIKKHSPDNHIFPLATSLLTAGGIPLASINPEEFLQFQNKVPDPFVHTFSPVTAKKIYSYWLAFMAIQHEVETILSVLTKEEKIWLKTNYHTFFFGKQDVHADYDFFTTDSPYPLKFFELASRIDLAKLADCARKLSLISDDFYQERETFETIVLEKDFIWEEKGLKFMISQRNHSQHQENADFFIDLGGYNTLYTNAGGTEGTRAVALHIDLKGHNTYHGQNFVQGSGFLGVGLLVSYSGNNTYHADSYAQGCGFFGVGFLVNLKGNNRFVLNFGGQSFALFGSSMLWNKEGENAYLANQGMAQAASSTLGVAFLVDNQGHNSYTSGVPGKGGTTRYGGIGQGGSIGVRGDPSLNNASFYGGLSFLYIGEGYNKLKTVWLGQGSAYFLGAGILVAEGSHDIFEADYDSQGQGLHLAVGLVIKKGEYGKFKGGWGSLGVSGDRSVGMFIGNGDNNSYEGTEQSIGSSRKDKSVGVFVNIGNQASYKFQKLSSAHLFFPQSPNEWSSALFLEVGTGSNYPQNIDELERGSDRQWGIENHSLGISTQFLSKNPIETLFTKFHASPQILFLFDPINGWPGNTSYQPLVHQPAEAENLGKQLSIASYDRRRQIYESLDLMRFKDRKIKYDLSYLLQNPTKIKEDTFNYAILWALRNKDKVDLKEIKNALYSKSFASEYTRKMAISLLDILWNPEVIPLFSQLMLEDKSEGVRYYAALTLAKHLSENSIDHIKQGLKSDSELVRYAIAIGLQESTSPSALALVTSLFNDKSFYVRRAAGLTALSLGDKKGVSIVLETAQYETLDTGDNYGDNIYKQLSNYLGVDFGLDKNAWIEWWDKVKDSFQIPFCK
jgi:HEAT repeats